MTNLKNGFYRLTSERSSTDSIAQYVDGWWWVIGEIIPVSLEELNKRGWNLGSRVEDTSYDSKQDADEGRQNTFYIDCEFDGHNGPLISMAVVRYDGESIYIKTPSAKPKIDSNPHSLGLEIFEVSWVEENVLPIVDSHNCERVYEVSYNSVGQILRDFIDQEDSTVIADSPVDIGYFCRAWSTGSDGNWKSSHMELITFKVINIDVYPTSLVGAIQHNAWYDAMALRHALKNTKSTD